LEEAQVEHEEPDDRLVKALPEIPNADIILRMSKLLQEGQDNPLPLEPKGTSSSNFSSQWSHVNS